MKRIATILLALMIVGVSIIPTMTSAATCDHSWVNVYTYIYQDTGSDTVHKVMPDLNSLVNSPFLINAIYCL